MSCWGCFEFLVIAVTIPQVLLGVLIVLVIPILCVNEKR